jgi:hypothetical protein
VSRLREGLSVAARNGRLLGWLLLANLALSFAAVAPMLGPLDEMTASQDDAGRLLTSFDMSWWVDVITARAESVARTFDAISVAAFLSVLTGCFFAGGTLQAYSDTLDGLPMDRFMTCCRKWFLRFVWLLALTLPLYWLVHQMVNTRLAGAMEGWLDAVEDERAGLAWLWGRSLLFLILFDLVTLAGDYARAHAILTSDRSMLAALSSGLRFVLRHPLKVFTLEAGAVLLQAIALALFLPVDALLSRSSTAGLMAGILAGQLFVLARLYLRESARAGHLSLYRMIAGVR